MSHKFECFASFFRIFKYVFYSYLKNGKKLTKYGVFFEIFSFYLFVPQKWNHSCTPFFGNNKKKKTQMGEAHYVTRAGEKG